MLRVDHVIFTVGDFDRAAERFVREYGLASVPGGRHAGHGTGNRIVPLGSSYIELMAIVDDDEARASPIGSWVKERLSAGGGPSVVCVSTDDIDSVSARLGLSPFAMSRSDHAGNELSWRLAGLEAALANPSLPFFIQWDVPDRLHPGRQKAAHRASPQGFARIELRGNEQETRKWLGEVLPEIRIAPGNPAIAGVAVATENGERVVR